MQEPNMAQRIVLAGLSLFALAGVGAGGAYLYHRGQEGTLFNPPEQARIDPPMIKGAWLNVVPQEDAAVAISMGRCLDSLHARSTKGMDDETALQHNARHCESEAMLLPFRRDLATKATERRLLLTASIWPGEPEHERFKFESRDEIKTLWDALARDSKEQAVALFLQECLEASPRVQTTQSLHGQAAMCENRSAFASGFDEEARDRLVAMRKQATGPGWPEYSSKSEVAAVEPAETKPAEVVEPAKTTPAWVVADGTRETAAIKITQPTAAPVATKITSPEPALSSKADIAAGPTVEGVIAAWMNTDNAEEISISATMAQCLRKMNGLHPGVMICELQAMNKSPMADTAVARRVAAFPSLQGAGKRQDTGVDTTKPTPPTQVAASTPAVNDPIAGMLKPLGDVPANRLPGAQEIIAKWSHSGLSPSERAIGARLTACLGTVTPLVQDQRGLELAVDTCKLRVQVDMERELNAAKDLLR